MLRSKLKGTDYKNFSILDDWFNTPRLTSRFPNFHITYSDCSSVSRLLSTVVQIQNTL